MLLGELVAVEGEGWMVLAMDKYDYGIFLTKQRNLYLNH